MERTIKGLAAALCVSALVTAPAMAADVSTKGGITVKSEDGNFKGQFGGRFMLDAAVFDNDTADNISGSEFRRLRFFSKGKIYGLDYKLQIDFADGDIATRDAYLQLPLLGGKVTVGQFFQYFSLEQLTSSKYITFMERSFVAEFAPSRQVGVGYWTNVGPFAMGASAYNTYVDEDGEDVSAQEGAGGSARVVFAPTIGDGVQLHLGGAVVREAGVQGRTRVRVRPAGHLSDASRTTLVDLNTGERAESLRYGIEAAAVAGPLSLQMEYVDGDYETDSVEQDTKAYYMYASYFLTGESRAYKASTGSFGRVKPRKAHGAYEVALRYDYAESDNDGTTPDLEVESITLGANWYMNPQVRLMLNLIAADVAEGADEPNAVTARLQFDF